ncbi:OTU domain-containing protein 6B [Xylographa opegraphella]|nr:OTU domain-containing protein 6B [Xylographa opegraphella]
MEELIRKYRQEQRDLQSKITQKKKAATKKTRKGINDECAELERQLAERHSTELSAATGNGQVHDDKAASDAEEDIRDPTPMENSTGNLYGPEMSPAPLQGKKPNRQKARLARRAAEQEAVIARATAEAASLPDLRANERLVMEKELKVRGLEEVEIRPDGHCLYSAVADQLSTRRIVQAVGGDEDVKPDYRSVRHVAANFISNHADDFSPFLEEPLEDYVVKIKDTAEWGGQLELSALARAYGLNINVLQGDGRVEKIEAGVEDSGQPIWLAYYRHSFGLGEHYNSLRASP